MLSQVSELVDEELASVDWSQTFDLSADRIEREVTALEKVRLSDEIEYWVNRYGEVGERHPYLWAWCRQGVELTTLDSVQDEHFDRVCDTKLLGVMFDVLVDDVADQGGDKELLDQLIAITTGTCHAPNTGNEQTDAYVTLAIDVWQEIQRRVHSLARHAEFADVLAYDYAQLMNAMRYSHLLNKTPSMLNLAEHDLYLPHNMHMMVSATIDLMASPSFDASEIGRLREAIWHSQYMGRIGNLVTTWKRELHEGDYTSGVFAHAVIHGQLSLDQLRGGDRETVARSIVNGGHEDHFLAKWQQHRRDLIGLQKAIESVDLKPLIEGLQRLICLHLASRGRK